MDTRRLEPGRVSRTAGIVLALAILALLTSCGGGAGEGGGPAGETRTAPNGDTFNDADVAFATDMIQHHAQALTMVDHTLGRNLDPSVQRLAEEIRAAQGPEIETMVDWLTAWEEPIPETSRDHANAHGDGHADLHGDLPGMMSGEQLTELEAAGGAEFEKLFLEMMIEHHEGAIEMARTEQADGVFEPAVTLAEQIEAAQQEQIETMEGLLGS